MGVTEFRKARMTLDWCKDKDVTIVQVLRDGALALVAGEGEVFLLPGEWEFLPLDPPRCAVCRVTLNESAATDSWYCVLCGKVYTSEMLEAARVSKV